MEGSLSDKQRIIQTTSDVFWTTQLTRNISKNDEQYFPGITLQRSIGKLYGWFHYTGQDNEGTQRMNN